MESCLAMVWRREGSNLERKTCSVLRTLPRRRAGPFLVLAWPLAALDDFDADLEDIVLICTRSLCVLCLFVVSLR